MLKSNSQITFVVALLRSLDSTNLGALLTVIWRILASLRGFSRRELNPQSFQSLELRLERFARDVAAMDLRLGLVGDRVRPALAHKLGRLAADLPQQPAIQQLAAQTALCNRCR